MADFTRNAVRKRFLEKARIDPHRNLSNKAVLLHNTKVEDELPPQMMDSETSQIPATKALYTKKTNQKAYSTFTSSIES